MTAQDVATTPRRSKNVPRLEGIRGIFALGVVTYHVSYTAGINVSGGGKGFVAHVLEGLQVCLPPFFVLSGMLLFRQFARSTLTGTKQPSAVPFYIKRALRILPAYWGMIVIVLLTLNFYSIHSVWYVLNPLLLVHFFTITNFSHWIIGTEPTWTVPTEMTFYLLLPILGLIITRYARRATDLASRARRMLVPITVFGALGLVWNAFVFWPSNKHTFYYNFWPFGFFSVVACGMALGVLSAYAEVAERPPAFYRFVARRPNACWLGALVVYFLSLPTFFGIPGDGSNGGFLQEGIWQVLLLLFGLLVIAPLSVPNVRSRLMDAVAANPVIRFFGRLSFAIYLWHVAAIHFWFKNGSIFGVHHLTQTFQQTGKAEFWALEAFVLAFTIVAALLSRYLIEQPAMRLRDRLVPSRERRTPTPPSREPEPAARR